MVAVATRRGKYISMIAKLSTINVTGKLGVTSVYQLKPSSDLVLVIIAPLIGRKTLARLEESDPDKFARAKLRNRRIRLFYGKNYLPIMQQISRSVMSKYLGCD